jgi:hypothetical protein
VDEPQKTDMMDFQFGQSVLIYPDQYIILLRRSDEVLSEYFTCLQALGDSMFNDQSLSS